MTLLTKPHVFERGDKIYLTTPLTLATPDEQAIEEFAFASAVKTQAPNGHIGWLQGRYVEAGKGNLNNAMWLDDELAIKALTPMLMPVTVMHDPRTAVGTIADCKLVNDEHARIDNILAIWKHRFPDVWEEAAENIKAGSMMQSMECLSPYYNCSECGQAFIKLHDKAEQASWCDHLRAQTGRRILGDVCFTGTGLIFGTRGGRGAYTDAHLDHFQDEIAEFHDKAHIDGRYRSKMGYVQIDEQELATIRRERDEAKRTAEEKASEVRTLTTTVEKAEADLTKEKERADNAEEKAGKLEETASQAQLKDSRWSALGTGFIAKLGEVTKTGLEKAAAGLSDEEWAGKLAEIEELTGVKRDEAASTTTPPPSKETTTSTEEAGTAFSDEELAAFVQKGGTAQPVTPAATGSVGRQLARSFQQKRQPAKTE